jgi:thiamine biosynthesis lipoprotein
MGAGIFAVSTLGVSVSRQRLVRRSVPVMGTIAEIAVATRDERRAHGAINAAIAELHHVQRLMSRFEATSDIGRANLAAFRYPVPVSAATAAVTAEALRWAAADDSAFDPAIGRAAELWDVTRRTEPPAGTLVDRLAARGLYRKVEIGRYDGFESLVYHDADVALDLGGIAKGYGVDRAAAALRDWGVTNGLINVGGDLYALGRSPDGDPWVVGIRSPHDTSIVDTIHITDAAVATSGDYQQYFDHQGRRYHHLIDPSTAAPRTSRYHSLSVVADCCMTADAAATAAFGTDLPRAAAMLARVAPDARITSG